MGKGNLKGLGPPGFVNTLDHQPNQRQADHHPSKRQRRYESSYTALEKSPYFVANKQHGQLLSGQDGSQDDPYDIKSLSSGGGLNRPSAGVPEFRNASVALIPKRGRPRRKSRGGLLSQATPSPDILAVEDHEDDDGPPPANIQSDIIHNGTVRRGRPPRQPDTAFKISKPIRGVPENIEDSEDELQRPSSGLGNGKKRSRSTNFDMVDEIIAQKRRATRGDIAPTEFRSAKKPLQRRAANAPLEVKEAVTGREFWESSPSKQGSLVLGDSNIFEFFVGDTRVAESWLAIELNTVREIHHASTKSPIVILKRRGFKGCPPSVQILFETVLEADQFIDKFGHSIVSLEKDPVDLEKEFLNMKKNAETWQEKNKPVAREERSKPSNGATSSPPATGVWDDVDELRPPKPRGEKLKDRLARSAQLVTDVESDVKKSSDAPDDVQITGRSLRSTSTKKFRRKSPSPLEQDRWSRQNSDWREKWKKSLVYPATGKNRATVDEEDIPRLDEGEFMNDNLISFYLRYLQVQLERERPEVLKKVHIFSSFFFEKLKSSKFEGVKGWTAKIDLFSYDYIVVPVNESAHWYLAIICNVGRILPGEQSPEEAESMLPNGDDGEVSSPKSSRQAQTIAIDDEPSSSATVRISDDKVDDPGNLTSKRSKRRSVGGNAAKLDTNAPRIMTLDSLDGSHSNTCRILKTYLHDEAKDKKGVDLEDLPGGMRTKGIPHQDNFSDCGVFVLGYMEEFLKDPDEAARRLLLKEDLNWNIKPQRLRANIRDLLFDLQQEQQDRILEEVNRRRALKAQKKAAAAGVGASDLSNENSVSQSRAATPTTPAPKTSPKTSPASDSKTSPKAILKTPEQASTARILNEPQPADQVSTPPPPPQSTVGDSSKDSSEDLVSPIKDSGSGTSSEAERYFSAAASPSDQTPMAGVESPPSAKHELDEVSFVELIPSSGSPKRSKSRKHKKRHRHEIVPEKTTPIEVEDDDDRLHQSIERDDERDDESDDVSLIVGKEVRGPVEVVIKGPSGEELSHYVIHESSPQHPQYEVIQRSIE